MGAPSWPSTVSVGNQAFSTWTPGANLNSFREIVFGSYAFPLTFQERNRTSKLAILNRKIPFTPGTYNPANISMIQRETEVYGTVGSLIYGSNGNQILTQDDLETERALLAGLQMKGVQNLFVRPDRYLLATMAEFDFTFVDGQSYRYADWVCKFTASDPRYYGTTPHSYTSPTYTSGVGGSTTVTHLGNTKSFPIISITGSVSDPVVTYTNPSGSIAIAFNNSYAGGSTAELIVNCDPRPENADNAVIYIPSSGSQAQAGLQFCTPSSFTNSLDFQYIYPYIDTSLYGLGTQTIAVTASGGTSWSFNVTWPDVWV